MTTVTAPLQDLVTWIDTTPPTAVALGLLRPAVLAVAGWLLVTTLLYVGARAARLPALVRATAPVTLPALRRLADRCVAVGLVTATTTVAVPGAALAASGPVPAAVAPLPPGLQVPAGGAPTTPAPTPTETATEDVARTHVVAPGEHLWLIAAHQVAAARGVDPSELDAGDVAPQWRRVVAGNTPRLRSGDPDLVHPGEVVILPDLHTGSETP